ncbi:MAG: glycosyltransferase family 4 protein, partial [bacterium]|nr:glycosyltransferase family 4 protein [bacterium]
KYGSESVLTEFVTNYVPGETMDSEPYLDRRVEIGVKPAPSSKIRLANLINNRIHLRKLRKAQRQIANRINVDGYDLAFVFPCRVEQTPSLLRYLAIPSLYYGAEVHRRVFEHPRVVEPEYRGNRQRGNFLSEPYYENLRSGDVRNAESATIVLANSYHTREAMIKTYGLFPVVVYNGLNLDRFAAIEDVAKEPAVLSVGLLSPIKGHRLVAEALARIPAAKRPELWIAYYGGEKGEEGYVSRFCEDNGISLKLTKGLDDEGLRDVYARARVVALGYVVEPLGLVPLEAMACGTPVVAVKEGGFRETIRDGEVGLLTERDPDDMAEAIGRLFDDDALYQRMVANCRPYIEENWDYRTSAERYYAIMREIVGG